MKKIKTNLSGDFFIPGRKYLRIMKLTFIFMLWGLISSATATYSQSTRLTFESNEATIESVFKQIESLSEFKFAYNSSKLDVGQKISVKADHESIDAILDKILGSTDFQYKIVDRYIIINDENGKNPTTLGSEQAAKTVKGKVTDASGATLPGVSVVVKGTTTGVITDANGDYSLSGIPANAILVFSFVGMKFQEITIGNKTTINVVLTEETIGIEEVVAIGYGTEKKINLTGSVASVDEMALKRKTTATQTSQLLAGEVSGLAVIESSGKPGSDGADLTIRGLGTFSGAGTTPLIIVDGIQSSIDNVNPNDIAKISVLKDAASASIYGSRAANGVIIIETKRGKEGAMQVSYDSYVGWQNAEMPDMLNSWEYAEAYNTAQLNFGGNIRYTNQEIEKFKSGEDPNEYPNKQHLKDIFNSGNGIQTKHDLSFSGGSKFLQYLFSAGYLRKNGMIERDYNNRFDFLLNLKSQLRDNLTLNVSVRGNDNHIYEPAIKYQSITYGLDMIVSNALQFNATVPGLRSDGSYGTYMGHPVPEAGLASECFQENLQTTFNSNVSLEWNIIKSLKLTGRVGYNYNNSANKLLGAEMDLGRGFVFGPSDIKVDWSTNKYLTMETFIDYEKKFGDHYLHGLGGCSQEESDYYYLGAFRDNFPVSTLPEIDVASPTNDSNNGGATTWRLRSYFGRLNYSFQQKYLLEGNLRYDGSSRFSKGNRFGLFPSMSACWIISKEKFFKIPWIQNLKLRGSYGVLGNQQIGTYPYQKVLNLGYNYYPGEIVQSGIRLSTLPKYDITWETTEVINGGLDINLFDGKLNFVIDHYKKSTHDILYNLTVSNVLGMSVGQQNAGKVENRGWDFELLYKNRIGEFSYSIHPTFSIVHNKVTELADVKIDINNGLFLGEPLKSYYGYETDGLFADQDDINNYATQNYKAVPGLIRYKDISGPEGIPDGKVTSDYDRKVLGSSFPKFNYGMAISANYKNFDFYAQAQGLGGMVRRIATNQLAIYNEGNIQRWEWEERWTKENPDRNAKYPLFISSYNSPCFSDVSDYWLRDVSFLRIKNISIGYNLPPKVLKSTFIDQCRIYISGRNLYTFDKVEKGWDPEMYVNEGYNTTFYPPTKVWSFGIDVTF